MLTIAFPAYNPRTIGDENDLIEPIMRTEDCSKEIFADIAYMVLPF